MVRWFKLFGDQYLGFWGLGLVLFVLQEVPYIVMPFFPLETNPIMQMTETSAALDLWEKILGSLCIALMIFVVHKDAVLFSVAGGRERLFFTLTVILLLANYFDYDAVHCGHTAAFLCGNQPLEAEYTPDSNRTYILRGALHPCAGEPDKITGHACGQHKFHTSMCRGT